MNNPVRILVDAHVFDGGYQGTRTFLKGIYSELLNNQNLEISFLARNTDQLKKEFPNEAARFIPLKSRSKFARMGIEIPSLVKKNRFDYVHFQYIVPPLVQSRLIVTIHDVIFNEFPAHFTYSYRAKKNLLYRYAAHKADILTTVSHYSKNSIQQFLNTGDKEIQLTPNGVDDIFFVPYNKADARQYIKERFGMYKFIFYVSRLEPRKNHLLLCKAYISLKVYEEGIDLVLAGEETIPVHALENFLHQLDPTIRKHIHLLGNVNQDELLGLYRACEAFVYPSCGEGFGIPPLEAAAAGVPVLCSNNSAMKEYLFFGNNLVPVESEDVFIQHLKRFLHQQPGNQELAAISSSIKDQYSWKKSAENLHRSIVQHSNNLKLKSHGKLRSA